MRHQPYSSRRQQVLAELGDGVAVIPTAPERLRNRDAHYPYRFDSYFWYLSGFPEPEATIVLVGGKEPRSILFCREKDEAREIWDGFRYGPETAADAFGFCEAHPIGHARTDAARVDRQPQRAVALARPRCRLGPPDRQRVECGACRKPQRHTGTG
jgi:Xaa-Pro aminopeptidase